MEWINLHNIVTTFTGTMNPVMTGITTHPAPTGPTHQYSGAHMQPVSNPNPPSPGAYAPPHYDAASAYPKPADMNATSAPMPYPVQVPLYPPTAAHAPLAPAEGSVSTIAYPSAPVAGPQPPPYPGPDTNTSSHDLPPPPAYEDATKF